MGKDRQTAHLEDWYWDNWTYKSKEGVLMGIVSGHPRVADGTFVHTSTLLGPVEDDVTEAKTLNTDYTLGKQDSGVDQ